MEKITLGSASPRRLELLKKLNINAIVKPPDIIEEMNPDLSVEMNAIKISRDKLDYIKSKNPNDLWIITADTFIVHKNNTMEKPKNRDDAFNMLHTLSGEKHKVLTGVSIYSKKSNQILSDVDTTIVTFKNLTSEEINYYLDFNEWLDAAGAYQIQRMGEILVESINGSYSSVMGLPISRIYGMLRSLNFIIPVI